MKKYCLLYTNEDQEEPELNFFRKIQHVIQYIYTFHFKFSEIVEKNIQCVFEDNSLSLGQKIRYGLIATNYDFILKNKSNIFRPGEFQILLEDINRHPYKYCVYDTTLHTTDGIKIVKEDSEIIKITDTNDDRYKNPEWTIKRIKFVAVK